MSPSVPPYFAELYAASSKISSDVNIMGVVTDIMSPSRSRGTDWIFTFSLADHTMGGISSIGGEGLKVRFFKPMEVELPQIKGIGDVVLIRNIKIKTWNGMTLAMSSFGTTWVVFPASQIPESVPSKLIHLNHVRGNRATVPSTHEMMYAIEACNWHDRSSYTGLPLQPLNKQGSPTSNEVRSATSNMNDKFSLITDLEVDTFKDLVVQVVKLYPSNGLVEMYVTDYSTNPLLFNYMWGDGGLNGDGSGRDGDKYNYIPNNGDGKKWPGPYGKQTLTVSLWNPHSQFAETEVKPHDFVRLRNVHVKWSKDLKIEGVLHSDRRTPDRIDVTVIKNLEDDERVKEVLRRKREYWAKAKQQAPKLTEEVRSMKRKAADEPADEDRGQKKFAVENPIGNLGDPNEMTTEVQKPSKSQARRRRRQQKDGAGKDKEHSDHPTFDKENHLRKSPEKKDPINNIIVKPSRYQLNPNVNCSHHLHPPRCLSAITSLTTHTNKTPAGTTYTLPFQNVNCRATVHIIDFYPPNIADFAIRSPRKSEYAILSDAEDEDSEFSGSANTTPSSSQVGERGWEWRFQLTLEDALGPRTSEMTTMKVYVAGPDAEYLLKLDAEDLHKSPEALTGLREKLFLLWGDLEERKRREKNVLTEGSGNSAGGQIGEPDGMKNGLPFQCCLKEYGVKVKVQRNIETTVRADGSDVDENEESLNDRPQWEWERKWRMHGCTII